MHWYFRVFVFVFRVCWSYLQKLVEIWREYFFFLLSFIVTDFSELLDRYRNIPISLFKNEEIKIEQQKIKNRTKKSSMYVRACILEICQFEISFSSSVFLLFWFPLSVNCTSVHTVKLISTVPVFTPLFQKS